MQNQKQTRRNKREKFPAVPDYSELSPRHFIPLVCCIFPKKREKRRRPARAMARFRSAPETRIHFFVDVYTASVGEAAWVCTYTSARGEGHRIKNAKERSLLPFAEGNAVAARVVAPVESRRKKRPHRRSRRQNTNARGCSLTCEAEKNSIIHKQRRFNRNGTDGSLKRVRTCAKANICAKIARADRLAVDADRNSPVLFSSTR